MASDLEKDGECRRIIDTTGKGVTTDCLRASVDARFPFLGSYIFASMIKLTIHAKERMAEYRIELAWIEFAITSPAWTEPDPRPGITRSFARIAARAGRVLRVAHQPDDADVVVLSVHFDRGARL